MIEILALLFIGILAGRLLHRSKTVAKFGSAMTVTVWILILALGFSVGCNPYLTSHLPSLGVEALLVGAFATAGSIFGVSLIRKFFKK